MGLNELCCVLASTFPKLVCTALLVWAYYTSIFKVYLPLVNSTPLKVALIVWTTIIFTICITLYYLVVAVGPGSPLEFEALCRFDYKDGDAIEPPALLVNRSVMVKQNGGYRFCNKCKAWKPDRCHHCSSCNRCILRMDHHCPWFAECVGFKNHKFFIQFITYGMILSGTTAVATTWANYGLFISDTIPLEKFSIHILLIFFLSVMFFLCLLVFDLFTVYQLLKNQTTIESYESQRYRRSTSKLLGNIFDLGYSRNWRSIMGNTWMEWLLPIRIRNTDPRYSDGLSFEVNQTLYERMEQESSMQTRLSNELERYRNRQQAIRDEATTRLAAEYS